MRVYTNRKIYEKVTRKLNLLTRYCLLIEFTQKYALMENR
jgi:hypothetical protein